MSGGDYFYEGANYGFDPEYGGFSKQYGSPLAENIGIATDPRTANQLKAVSEKLSTGATAVEVSTVSPDVFESIPKEHFKELNQLRKLVGGNVELTLHAPIVEPTGLSKRGWNEYEREQAERQMWDAVEKAHEINPKGNVVTTFHASAISFPVETVVWEEKEIEGEKKKIPVMKEVALIDKRTGNIGVAQIKPSALEKEEGMKEEELIKNKVTALNKESWDKSLQHLNYDAENGAEIIERSLRMPEISEKLHGAEKSINPNVILKCYKDYTEGKEIKLPKEIEPELAEPTEEFLKDKMQHVLHGDLFLRNAYNNFRELFDQAYDTAKLNKEESTLQKLDKFRHEVGSIKNYLDEPEKVHEFASKIREGVRVLRSIGTPETMKPAKEFVIDKSSDTFSNVALNSYKKFGEHSPIISIENPPAGQGMIYTGKDLNSLIEETRKKFIDKAVDKLGMSKSQAKAEADKIIGATWDVGHINMLRKYGAGEKEVLGETKALAKKIKHMHLSDNFGMEHTELPMGMGNVPTKEMMKIAMEYNKKFKKIIEAGNWYQHFQTTPLGETLSHFGSPIYAMKNVSYWGPQGYFAGYGANPEIHHALYGAGFANLPVELGGQMTGKSRLSGAPME